MKKIFVLAIMAMFVTASQAQIVSSRSSRVTTTKTIGNYEGWNTVYLQWNPSTFSPKKGDSESYTGFSVGYNHAFSVSQSIPLFVEAGLGVQYSFTSKFYDWDVKINLLSAKVPVSLLYKWMIPNSTIALIPKAGVDFRFNILGTVKPDGASESYNLFDKDEVGPYECKRFQIGWHAGFDVQFNDKFLVGFTYGTDFMDMMEDCKLHTMSVTLGYCF